MAKISLTDKQFERLQRISGKIKNKYFVRYYVDLNKLSMLCGEKLDFVEIFYDVGRESLFIFATNYYRKVDKVKISKMLFNYLNGDNNGSNRDYTKYKRESGFVGRS